MSSKTKSVKWMFIKFIIGLGLLSLSRGYLQKHPAEKDAIFSGLKMMGQTIEGWTRGLFGHESSSVQKQLLHYYKDLSNSAGYIAGCSGDVLTQIHDEIDTIRDYSSEAFERVALQHYQTYTSLEKIVGAECVSE